MGASFALGSGMNPVARDGFPTLLSPALSRERPSQFSGSETGYKSNDRRGKRVESSRTRAVLIFALPVDVQLRYVTFCAEI